MMKVAIPHWQGRVSPVFDSANRLLVADIVAGRIGERLHRPLVARDPAHRAAEVLEGGAEVLICGAISWPMEMAVCAVGVQVISQVCGQVEEVLTAFINQRLSDPAYLMPGCCGRRRRFQGGSGRLHKRGHGREPQGWIWEEDRGR